MEYKVGDKVYMKGELFKVIHIYDNGNVKLQSVRGKRKFICYNVPTEFIDDKLGN